MNKTAITPLITDIKKLPIGPYLATSGFERLIVKNGMGPMWNLFYDTVKKDHRVFILGYDFKPGVCKNTLILIINELFDSDKEILNKILFHVFHGYIEWNYNEIDLSDLFEDLVLIDFPDKWLKELKIKYLNKNQIILKNIELNGEDEGRVNEDLKLTETEIFAANKSVWRKLIEKAKLKDAMKEIIEYAESVKDVKLRDELILQSAMLTHIENKSREGTIDLETESMELRKINKAILEVINNLE
ncbi:MAG: hypothetical protein R3D00_22690 [Bacteroidia bacterium]